MPLCLIGTAIFKIFGRPKKNVKPKNILFIELSEMGSAILVDPAMQKAKKAFDADLFFLIFKKNKPSLQLLNTVDDKNIFTINADGIISLIKDTWKFLFWARKRKIDTCIETINEKEKVSMNEIIGANIREQSYINIKSNSEVYQEKEIIDTNTSIGTVISRQDYINIEEVEK